MPMFKSPHPSNSLPARILRFYIEGFRSMTIGRKLWALIIIKLAFIFLIMKLFFPTSSRATMTPMPSGPMR